MVDKPRRRAPWDKLAIPDHQHPLRFSLTTKQWASGDNELHEIHYLVAEVPPRCYLDLEAARRQVQLIVQRLASNLERQNSKSNDSAGS